jgi:hypothetical protein
MLQYSVQWEMGNLARSVDRQTLAQIAIFGCCKTYRGSAYSSVSQDTRTQVEELNAHLRQRIDSINSSKDTYNGKPSLCVKTHTCRPAHRLSLGHCSDRFWADIRIIHPHTVYVCDPQFVVQHCARRTCTHRMRYRPRNVLILASFLSSLLSAVNAENI